MDQSTSDPSDSGLSIDTQLVDNVPTAGSGPQGSSDGFSIESQLVDNAPVAGQTAGSSHAGFSIESQLVSHLPIAEAPMPYSIRKKDDIREGCK
jgi:hypothetical protein